MRALTAEEHDIVAGMLHDIGVQLDVVIHPYDLALDDGTTPPRVCLVPVGWGALPGAAEMTGGVPIGTLEEHGFGLDLQGAVLAAPRQRRAIIRVTEKASRLFLYGRDILGDSVERASRGIEPGDVVVVTNPRGEALGLGHVVGRFKGGRSAVRAVHDLGRYLRDQDRLLDRGRDAGG